MPAPLGPNMVHGRLHKVALEGLASFMATQHPYRGKRGNMGGG